MKELILILSQNPWFTERATYILQRFGVERIDFIADPAMMIPLDRLSETYNIILIDKSFAGGARKTAPIVQRIRKVFFGPMIGFETLDGDGSLFSLRVAGCNFSASILENGADHGSDLCLLIGQVGNELNQPHQNDLSSQLRTHDPSKS